MFVSEKKRPVYTSNYFIRLDSDDSFLEDSTHSTILCVGSLGSVPVYYPLDHWSVLQSPVVPLRIRCRFLIRPWFVVFASVLTPPSFPGLAPVSVRLPVTVLVPVEGRRRKDRSKDGMKGPVDFCLETRILVLSYGISM